MPTVDQVLAQYYNVLVETETLIEIEAQRYAPGNEEQFTSLFGSLCSTMSALHYIFLQQYEPQSMMLAQVLAGGINFYDGDFFRRHLEAMRISGSLYDIFTQQKIQPDFTEEDFNKILPPGETIEDIGITRDTVHALLFNPDYTPTLPTSRGFYPPEINAPEQERILAEIRDCPALRSHYTAVVYTDGELHAVPFRDTFHDELLLFKISVDLDIKKLEAIAGDAPAKKAEGIHAMVTYLREQARANRMLDSELAYAHTDRLRARAYKVQEPAPFFLGLSFESIYDDPFKMKMAMTGTLSLETEACRALAPFVAKFLSTGELEKNIPYAPAIRADVPFVPVLMHDCIYRAGHAAIGPQALASTYRSEDKHVNDEEGVVIVAWRNVIAAKAEAILSPIAREILPAEKVAGLGDDFDKYLAMAFSVGILSHEQRHFIGARMDELELQAALGELYNDFDEGEAEIGRVYSFRELSEGGFEKLDARSLEEFLYDTYFADMFRYMRFGASSPYRRSAEWRLNYFVQQDCVEVADTVHITDYAKFKDAVADLYALHLEIMQTGNREKADAFVRQYALTENSPLFQQKVVLIDRINNKGIPRDIALHYQV